MAYCTIAIYKIRNFVNQNPANRLGLSIEVGLFVLAEGLRQGWQRYPTPKRGYSEQPDPH
jgi:hypothetical protein